MKMKTLKHSLLIAGLAAGSMATGAVAQIGIGIQFGRTPPPPLRYERRPPMPGPGYIWTDGYWNWSGGRYVWVTGHWQQPPYAGAYWSHGHWDHYPEGWRYHEGHWDREDHDDHYDWHR